MWVTILSLYGQQQRRAMEAHGLGPVACALPGGDGEGGDPAEEILRGMQVWVPAWMRGCGWVGVGRTC